jgi:hypothetical protein
VTCSPRLMLPHPMAGRLPHALATFIGMMVWMDDVNAPPESELLAAARRSDPAAFERLVAGP